MRRCALLILFVAVTTAPALAADITWLGVNSTWTNVANWGTGTGPVPNIGDNACFAGSAGVAQPTWTSVVGGFKFNSGGWTVTTSHTLGTGISVADGAGHVAFTGDGTLSVTSQVWYVGAGSTLSVATDISGLVTKTGTGTLQFITPSAQIWTGMANIVEGRVEVNPGGDWSGLSGLSVTVGQASGNPASLVYTAPTGKNSFLRNGGSVTINATGTIDFGVSNADGIGPTTINGGSMILPSGKDVTFGYSYTSSSITMAGGSITGSPGGEHYLNHLLLFGPSITSNAASSTATIVPGIWWQGGTSTTDGSPSPAPMVHTVTVADGAPEVDMDIRGGLINYWYQGFNGNASFVKAGAGTLRIGGDINWAGSLTVNTGTLQYDGAYNPLYNWGGPPYNDYADIIVNNSGALSGIGTIWVGGTKSITVNAGGLLKPGSSLGSTLYIQGVLGLNNWSPPELENGGAGSVLMGGTAASPAVLAIQIASTGSSQLAFNTTTVSGVTVPAPSLTINNGGPTLLQLNLLGHFVLSNATTYTIVNGFASLTGTFANAAGVTNSGRVDLGNGGWEGVVTYDNTNNQITLSNLVLAGDADGDGNVTFADYQALEAGFGNSGTWATGDVNGDGQVTFADYQLLEAHFGYVTPEPASLTLLTLGGLALVRRRRA
jgi:autotransporter-associated beta strand protein